MWNNDPPGGANVFSARRVRLHTLPSGDVFDLYPLAPQTDAFVEHLLSVDDVIAMGMRTRNAYAVEALVHRLLSRRAFPPEEHLRLRSAPIGLNLYPLLRDFRDVLKKGAEEMRSTTEEVRLVLWGTPARPTRLVSDGMGLLLRAGWIQQHLDSHPDKYMGQDIRDLMLEWARACGVVHWKTEETIVRRLLCIPPRANFATLDQSAVQLAMTVVPTDRVLAVHFFRCLQRVAAFQWRGHIIWPSAWLRGPRASSLAIIGASGYSGELTALLKQHVLALVENHRAGKRAARYQLKLALPPGHFDVKDFAAEVGVRVDARGAPQGLK